MQLHRSLVIAAALLACAVVLPRAARAAENARGAELFELCTQCHGAAGEGNPLALAPSIAGLPEWYVLNQLGNFKSGARGTNPHDLGGLRMYPMSLTLKTEEDVKAISAYVASLPYVSHAPSLQGGDPARGATLYAPCTACHGPDAKGMAAVQAPPLTGQYDWYLLSSLQKFKAGERGTYPNAAIMRGMAATLTDEQAMKDVIAYIESLSANTAANAAQ